MAIAWRLYHLFLFVQFKDSRTLLQSVRIQFEPLSGAKYYEIRFLVNELGGEQEEEKIIQIKNNILVKQIFRRYRSFQVRAIFSNEVKTSWSLSRRLDTKEEEIDYSKLILSTDVRYRTILRINHPYYYRNNILWVGPNTKLSLQPANALFVNKKEIFYQFRQKNQPGDDAYILFTSTVMLRSIFQSTEDPYIISFYSVNDRKFRERVREMSLYVDTNSPEIIFKKTDKILFWKFSDKSLPVKAILKQNNVLLKSRTGVTSMKLDLSKISIQDTSSLSLRAIDFLGNQKIWTLQ